MFEKLKRSLQGPESDSQRTQREMSERHKATEDKFQAEDFKRQADMAKRREGAEARDIEQAQKDMQEVPKQLAGLEERIKQVGENAANNRGRAYDAQFKSGESRGAYAQEATADDIQVKILEEEKLRLNVKLDKATRFLESRELLNTEAK